MEYKDYQMGDLIKTKSGAFGNIKSINVVPDERGNLCTFYKVKFLTGEEEILPSSSISKKAEDYNLRVRPSKLR